MQRAPKADELLFLPLGGTGEVGMNVYLYGHAERWLMVDFGIGFADERYPGIDILLPDPTFITEQADRLEGLVLTHAHEDHLGAIPYLWERLRCPIYATAFTCAVLRRKLAEAGIYNEVELVEIPLSGELRLGPFTIEFITVTHSIPEPNLLLIRTEAGTVLHTGDWKLDPDPLVGADYDLRRLKRLSEDNILAVVGDSTNALVPGHSGSEAAVRESLTELVGELQNRVAVTCFATNVARVETVAHVAEATGRRLALVGRSMHTIVRAAQEAGYLQDLPPLLDEREVGYLPREEVLLLVTGSQGEPRAALARIARDEHPEVVLTRGDAVIFSSRIIPGNEKAIHAVQNQLLHAGIEVLTEEDHFVHVSGHPCREELTQLYQWARPRIAVPMHGEPRHLLAHAQLARECQVPQTLVPEDGQVVRLAPGDVTVLAEVPVGRLAVDGDRIVPSEGGAVRERRKLSFEGVAVLSLVVDGDGRLADDPQLSVYGVLPEGEAGAEIADQVLDTVERAVQKLQKRDRRNPDVLRETARLAVRRTLQQLVGRKPITTVHLVALD